MSARSFEEQINMLRRTLPSALIKTRKQGGTTLEYLEWHAVADILDRYSPNWSCEIKEVREIGNYLMAIVAITIDGVRRENTGIEELDAKGYGDKVSNAVAMGFKRAAAMFGVGRDLYQDHSVIDILEAAEEYDKRNGTSPVSSQPSTSIRKPVSIPPKSNNNDNPQSLTNSQRIENNQKKFDLTGDLQEMCDKLGESFDAFNKAICASKQVKKLGDLSVEALTKLKFLLAEKIDRKFPAEAIPNIQEQPSTQDDGPF